MDKDADAFRTISEVAEGLDLPQHVLRFWETRFTQIKPLKRGGGRRYYRPDDVDLVRSIKHLLYGEGYTIKGVQRLLKEQGVRAMIDMARNAAVSAPGQVSARSATVLPADDEETDADIEARGAGFDHKNLPPGLTAEQIGQLHDALAEIEECSRLLAAARAG